MHEFIAVKYLEQTVYSLQLHLDNITDITTYSPNLKTIRLSEESAAMWKKHLERDDSKIVGKENIANHFFRGPFMVTTDSCHCSICADLFSGQLRSSLHCSVCSHYSNTFDVFCDLSLPIPKRGSAGEVSLRDCLDFFSQEEKLDKENSPVSNVQLVTLMISLQINMRA